MERSYSVRWHGNAQDQDIGALPDRVYCCLKQSGAAMSDTAKRQYTAEIVQFDDASKTIDETSIPASTDDEAKGQARMWARKECARRGIGQAWLIVRPKDQKPILNDLVF